MKVNSRMTKSSFLFSQDGGTYSSLRYSGSYKQGAGFGTQRLHHHGQSGKACKPIVHGFILTCVILDPLQLLK